MVCHDVAVTPTFSYSGLVFFQSQENKALINYLVGLLMAFD